MFKKLVLFLIVVSLVFFCVGSSFAKDKKIDNGRKIESWYHSFTLGYVQNTKVNEIDQDYEMGVALDFLRFYLPVGNKFMIGAGIFGTGLTFEGSDAQMNLYLYSASMQYYFKSIGDGLFLRGDVGMSRGVITDSSGDALATSDPGMGFLLGAGYALPISSETSILFYAAYRQYEIGGYDYSDLSFNVGWLW